MTAGLVTGVVHGVLGAMWGGVLGGAPGGAIGAAAGLALGVPFGWSVATSATYRLTTTRGALRFLVDHTWSLPNTVAGAFYLAVNLLLGSRLDRDQSRHSGSVILVRGVLPGYATTIGTVQAGTTPRVRCHEDLHVWQARLFGPCYLPLVAANYVVATVVPYWLLHRARDPIDSVGAYFLRGVYPHVWHEWWAFRAERAAARARRTPAT